MISADARKKNVERHNPFEQLREPLRIGVGSDPGRRQDERLEIASLDVGENRIAAVAVRIPEREVPGAETIGKEGEERELDAAEIPRKEVCRVEERLVKKQD